MDLGIRLTLPLSPSPASLRRIGAFEVVACRDACCGTIESGHPNCCLEALDGGEAGSVDSDLYACFPGPPESYASENANKVRARTSHRQLLGRADRELVST
jgi:hypothetical protein